MRIPEEISTPRGRLHIRAAELDDLPAFKELRLQALRDHPIAFSADYEQHQNGDDEFWRNYLNFDGDGVIFLAVDRDALVGMTGIGLGHSSKTRHGAVIWGVYVRPEWRGHRVAEALIRACLEWGRSHGVVVARLGVAKVNTPAIRCYERCGFEAYGIEPRAIYYQGTYYDEILMGRSLEQP